MSTDKHTPGPWEITEDLGMDEAWCNWHRVGPVDLMGGKANADSRLIAAAPDMLEALKAAKELADVMEGLSAGRSDDEWIWAAQEKINAAIARAIPLNAEGGDK